MELRRFGNRSLAAGLICLMLTITIACTVDQVLADIDLVIQMTASITTAVGAVSPVDAAAIQVAVNIATTGLAAVQMAYDTYKASGATTDLTKLQAAIAAVKTNLAQELAALHITDSVATQKVTAWVNLVTVTLNAVLGLLPQLGVTAISAQYKVEVISPKVLRARWVSDVCRGDAICGNLVKVRNIR